MIYPAISASLKEPSGFARKEGARSQIDFQEEEIMNTIRMALVLSCLAVVVACSATATPLSLNPVADPGPYYQQTTNNPCVIGDPSCHSPAGWTYTTFAPGASSYTNVASPTYTVAQIFGIVGSNTFMIGVDVNQTNVVQTLGFFGMYVNGNLVFDYSPASPTPVPPTSGGGNGNGWADYTLSGFSLAGLQPTDLVQFKVTMPLVNDGREEFFLISTPSQEPPPPIPEPTTSALIGGGLIGLGLLSRRFRKQTN